jgi:hypothetical protein
MRVDETDFVNLKIQLVKKKKDGFVVIVNHYFLGIAIFWRWSLFKLKVRSIASWIGTGGELL